MIEDADNSELGSREGWQQEIGRFLLAFGQIEWATYRLLIDLPTERIFETVCETRLSYRIRLILQIASQRNLPENLVARLEKTLSRVRELSGPRNTIAHNPIYWKLVDSELGVDLGPRIIRFYKPEKEIGYKQLVAFADEAESLAHKLYSLYIEVGEELMVNAVLDGATQDS